MKIKNSEFMTSAVKPEQYPESDTPEIAFAGRSNVGKSSLINMLLNRKGLAKTSSTPGKTQLVNFFNIDDKFRLVDLPGYGYARVSKEKKKNWGTIIETYLSNRENLLEIFLLVDIRHTPTDEDVQMYKWIKAFGYNGIVIATKLDKVKKSHLNTRKNDIRKTLGMEPEDVLITASSDSRQNKYMIWDCINELFEVNGYDIYFERQSNK
jgi:GTP-binding protein